MGGPKFVDENEAEKATADSAKASCLESFPQPATWPMVTEWAEAAIALFEACGLGGDYSLYAARRREMHWRDWEKCAKIQGHIVRMLAPPRYTALRKKLLREQAAADFEGHGWWLYMRLAGEGTDLTPSQTEGNRQDLLDLLKHKLPSSCTTSAPLDFLGEIIERNERLPDEAQVPTSQFALAVRNCMPECYHIDWLRRLEDTRRVPEETLRDPEALANYAVAFIDEQRNSVQLRRKRPELTRHGKLPAAPSERTPPRRFSRAAQVAAMEADEAEFLTPDDGEAYGAWMATMSPDELHAFAAACLGEDPEEAMAAALRDAVPTCGNPRCLRRGHTTETCMRLSRNPLLPELLAKMATKARDALLAERAADLQRREGGPARRDKRGAAAAKAAEAAAAAQAAADALAAASDDEEDAEADAASEPTEWEPELVGSLGRIVSFRIACTVRVGFLVSD